MPAWKAQTPVEVSHLLLQVSPWLALWWEYCPCMARSFREHGMNRILSRNCRAHIKPECDVQAKHWSIWSATYIICTQFVCHRCEQDKLATFCVRSMLVSRPSSFHAGQNSKSIRGHTTSIRCSQEACKWLLHHASLIKHYAKLQRVE